MPFGSLGAENTHDIVSSSIGEEFDFDPALDSNAYYNGIYNMLRGQYHYSSKEGYIDILQSFIQTVISRRKKPMGRGGETNVREKEQEGLEKAMSYIKYSVALWYKTSGIMNVFWEKMRYKDRVEGASRREINPHFPRYFHNSRFMSLITKIVTSAPKEKPTFVTTRKKTREQLERALTDAIPNQGGKTNRSPVVIYSTFPNGKTVPGFANGACYVTIQGEVYNPEDIKSFLR